MAHKKGGGSVKNNRDSISKRLGLKKYNFNLVKRGNILVRQRGKVFSCEKNVILNKDYTVTSNLKGFVLFGSKNKIMVSPYLLVFLSSSVGRANGC